MTLGPPAVLLMLLAASGWATASSRDTIVIWYDSQGHVGVERNTGLDDSLQSCSRLAPLENSCDFTDLGIEWVGGFLFPPLDVTGVGAFVGSLSMNISDTYGHYAVLECDVVVVNLAQAFPPPLLCTYDGHGSPFGLLHASFHAGAMDASGYVSALPTTNTVEAAVGTWGGFFGAA